MARFATSHGRPKVVGTHRTRSSVTTFLNRTFFLPHLRETLQSKSPLSISQQLISNYLDALGETHHRQFDQTFHNGFYAETTTISAEPQGQARIIYFGFSSFLSNIPTTVSALRKSRICSRVFLPEPAIISSTYPAVFSI